MTDSDIHDGQAILSTRTVPLVVFVVAAGGCTGLRECDADKRQMPQRAARPGRSLDLVAEAASRSMPRPLPGSRTSGPQGMIEDEALGHAADARAIVDRHGAAGMLVDVDDEVG